MTRYKTRKINITYRLSKRRQRCETDSWWQTIPRIYNTFRKKNLPHTTGTSRFKQLICMSTSSCGRTVLKKIIKIYRHQSKNYFVSTSDVMLHSKIIIRVPECKWSESCHLTRTKPSYSVTGQYL